MLQKLDISVSDWPSATQRSFGLVRWHRRPHWLVGGPECSWRPMRSRRTCRVKNKIQNVENWKRPTDWLSDLQNKTRTKEIKRPTWIHSPRLCSLDCGTNIQTRFSIWVSAVFLCISVYFCVFLCVSVCFCVSIVINSPGLCLTSCRWSERTFSPGSRRCFFLSGSAKCRWRSASSEQQKHKMF